MIITLLLFTGHARCSCYTVEEEVRLDELGRVVYYKSKYDSHKPNGTICTMNASEKNEWGVYRPNATI